MVDNRFLELKKISKTYPGVKALDEVNMDICQGEIHALVGENGAGKSTLIKILAGAEIPDPGGGIYIDGEAVSFSHPLESLRRRIAVTYQDLSLFPNLSVVENITISRQIEEGAWRLDWEVMTDTARDALARLDLNIGLNTKLADLSLANQQLVAITRALVHDARLLILDEPTSTLSHEEVNALFRVIETLKHEGMSVLFISHKLDEVFAIADRITVLRDGQHVGTYPRTDLDEAKLISLMVGRDIRFAHYERLEPGPPLLNVKGLHKRGHFAGISFTLHEGEILGLTGLVGAGRTEVAQAIFGQIIPDGGQLFLHGEKVNIDSTNQAVKAGIAYIPESRQTQGLFLGKTLADNLSVIRLDSLVNRFGLIRRDELKSYVQNWIKKLAIRPPYPEMVIDQFSGGNQQKTILAKWLAYEPKVLIVDEPTNGIDVGAKSEIHQLLRDLAGQGMGIIMISSELPEVIAVCDRILVMRRGRIAAEFDKDTATQEKIMNVAILGNNAQRSVS
ncbi:MAG: sugar ABC transporter ATP-binding protein [Firmicutes bacterium]|nr:sugar ABC transporter ATP-binding protein [Bacillota bacterium]